MSSEVQSRNSLFRSSSLLPIAAVVLGIVFGGLLIWASGANPLGAYGAMLDGALGSAKGWGRTLDKATPLILSGLAVAFAFKAGLFNIGGQGQLLIGAAFAAYIGFRFNLPTIVHIPFALFIGGLVAALVGVFVGVLKAYRGTHEVITTIMLNFVAGNITDWLVSRDGPWTDPNGGAIARSPQVADSAAIPRIGELPVGFAVAVLAAVVCWWILSRTTFGFSVNTVGANKHAAVYSGIKTKWTIINVMAISAFLAGLGGAIETQGVVGKFQPGFNAGLGFDGITIALLARNNPLAVIPAALLFGAMDAGAVQMQSLYRVEPEIISIVQAFILFFVAAPQATRWFLRQQADDDSGLQLSTGWGG